MTKEEWLNAAHGSRNELKEKFKEALKKTKNENKAFTVVLGGNGSCYIVENYKPSDAGLDFITFENAEEVKQFENDLDFWFELFFETFIERIELTF